MTYNIRLDTPDDGVNSWTYRKEAVASLLQVHAPAFIGTQEGFSHQLLYIDSVLTRYTYIGVGRDDGVNGGEHCALFYDSTLFRVQYERTFWLSQWPDSVSYGWDSDYHRICTYGLFQHLESGKFLWVFNTHYDHVARIARRNSSHLILKVIQDCISEQPAPVLLLGDFNATVDEEPIAIITRSLDDSLVKATVTEGDSKGTFTGFQSDKPSKRRIDYVFVDNLVVDSYYQFETRRMDGEFLSDHLPVMACLRFASQ